MNNSWNQWVLNYTQSKQLQLLRNLGFSSPSWEDLSYVLIAIGLVEFFLLPMFLVRRWRSPKE